MNYVLLVVHITKVCFSYITKIINEEQVQVIEGATCHIQFLAKYIDANNTYSSVELQVFTKCY